MALAEFYLQITRTEVINEAGAVERPLTVQRMTATKPTKPLPDALLIKCGLDIPDYMFEVPEAFGQVVGTPPGLRQAFLNADVVPELSLTGEPDG